MRVAIITCVALLSACSQRDAAVPARQASAEQSPAVGQMDFTNKVWSVRESTAVEKGSLYVFLSDGTLLMTSTHGTPALGKWTYKDGGLTMIEEGIPYKTDILSQTAGEFSIRSHNPGEPVDITFEPAKPAG